MLLINNVMHLTLFFRRYLFQTLLPTRICSSVDGEGDTGVVVVTAHW